MIIKKHPAQILFEDFCTFYNQRDLRKIIALLDSQPKFLMWDSKYPSDQVLYLEQKLETEWIKSSASELLIMEPLTLSVLPSCWAIGLFNLKTKIKEDFYTFTHLRGNIFCIKKRNLWKIKDIRFTSKLGNLENKRAF
jgi:hypothetical protein